MEGDGARRAQRSSAAVASARIHEIEDMQAELDAQLEGERPASRKRKRSVSTEESSSGMPSNDSSATESDLERGEDDLDQISVIVGHRLRKAAEGEEEKKSESRRPYALEYLVKLKGESHRHCLWTLEEELCKNPRARTRLKRYRAHFKDEGEILDCCNDDPLADTVFREVECVLHFDQIPLDEDDMADEEPCCVCGKSDDAPRTILCDSCDRPFHLYCLQPPLRKIPEGEWFCKDCLEGKKDADEKARKAAATEGQPEESKDAAVKEEDLAAAAAAAFEPGRTPRRFSAVHRDALEHISRLLPPLAAGHAFTYFCKWRGLSYIESTWEELDVEASEEDALAVLVFWRRDALMKKRLPKPIPPSGRQFAPLLTPETIPLEQSRLLRPYQVEGVNWLMNHWELQRGSLLADEMGLGKTLQILSFLATLAHKRKQLGPFLVIAPLSTLTQWKGETEKWTDMRCLILHGHEKDRAILKDFELATKPSSRPDQRKHAADAPGRYRFHVLVTSYDMAIIEKGVLGKIPFSVLVVDEAQRLKNSESVFRTSLAEQPFYGRAHKIALTGTPIQNNVEELYSILNFINPANGEFVNKSRFLELYGNPKDAECVRKLQALLRGYLLRRCKADVEKDLPGKVETIVDVELTPMQKQYYRAILERNKKFLNRGLKTADQPSLMNVFMQLRKLCNHPFLISGARNRVDTGEYVPAELGGPGNTDRVMQHPLVSCSGKIILLHKLLHKITSQGEKVLIFSQLVMMLDLLAEYLALAGYDFVRLDGRIDGAQRAMNIERFKNDDKVKVFLISTRAGGMGLNLQNASHVVIYDSDWNPQNDLQAQARTHRIGQTREVRIYRLLTRKTYEQRLMRIASLKLGLDAAILGQYSATPQSLEASTMTQKERTKEIERLLREGSYEILIEDEKTAEETAKAFAESNIDTILESAREIEYKTVADSGGGSLFAKATFVASNCDTTVELDDPDFWTKLLPEISRCQQMLAALSIALHRIREALVLRRAILDEKKAQPASQHPESILVDESIKESANLWDAHVQWWTSGTLNAADSTSSAREKEAFKYGVMDAKEAEAYPGAKDLSKLLDRAVAKALDHGRDALSVTSDKQRRLCPEDKEFLSDSFQGAPDPVPDLKTFADKLLAEAERAETIRLAGDPFDEMEAMVNLLHCFEKSQLFTSQRIVRRDLNYLRLATRIPLIRTNIEKPKRRRKFKVQYLGDDNLYAEWAEDVGSNSGEDVYNPVEIPKRDKSSAAGEAEPSSEEMDAEAQGGALATKEETLVWAERVQRFVDLEKDRKEYESKVAGIALDFSNSYTQLQQSLKHRVENSTTVAVDNVARAIQTANAKRPTVEATSMLQRMMFLPPCLHEETRKIVAQRRQRLVMYPPSNQLPFLSPYVIHITWCNDPASLFEARQLKGGWCTLTSKVSLKEHVGNMEGPFGFLAGDVILSLNNCSVRRLQEPVAEVLSKTRNVKMRLVRFVNATHPMGWSEVELVGLDGTVIEDVDQFARQFPGWKPLTFEGGAQSAGAYY